MNKHSILLLATAALVPLGCTMAPKYSRPATPAPASWPQGAAYTAALPPATAPTTGEMKWRSYYTDEKLQQVIGLALTNNRNLRTALLNVEQARGMYGVQRAELMPRINGTADGLRKSVPADLSSTGSRQTVKEYNVNLGVAAWEIDLFGRLRSLKDNALQEYLATEEARRGAQVSLLSSVAQAYLALAADRDSLALAQSTLAAQQDTHKMIRRRHELGLISELDVRRAQAQVDAARKDVALFTQVTAQDENALNLLAGGPIPPAWLPKALDGVAAPKDVQPGLPSDALLRRPDVLQAEHELMAANANIGAARAAFFPRISLTAAAGTSSSDLSGLFKAGSGAWSYAPQIVLPVFDARTWAANRVAKAQRELAVARYENSIQTAFREVADTLAVRGTVDQQLAAQQSLVQAVADTHRLSLSRYDKGIDSYLGVLDAQRSLYAAQQGLISLRLAKLDNGVRLYAVLGGGSDTSTPPAAAAAPAKSKP
jgi:outer membrane protein, multidrug efflux system